MTILPPLDPPQSRPYEPSWEMAAFYPVQGAWSEAEYLRLAGNRLVEFDRGYVEVLAMPTPLHQRIVALLYRLLFDWIAARRAGEMFFAPLPLRVAPRRYREPDLMFVAAEHAAWIGAQALTGADLVAEVVSGDRERDFVDKRDDYARLGVAEYWIVDPREAQIHVLTLDATGAAYSLHGVFERGAQATSRLLPGLAVDVTSVFDQPVASE